MVKKVVNKDDSKVLSCAFWDDVLCSYRKFVMSGDMEICFDCSHYKRFMDEMEEEDKEFWEWEAEVRKHPEKYLRGEL